MRAATSLLPLLTLPCFSVLFACGDGGEDGYGVPPLPPADTDGEEPEELPPDPSTDGVPHDCGEVTVQAEVLAPRVVLALDWSGSMKETWDHDGDPATEAVARWTTLHGSVDALLTSWASKVAFGAMTFPSWADENSDGCVVDPVPDAEVALDNQTTILASIPTSDATPSGGTPTRAAVQTAADVLEQLDGEGARAVVVLSDGEARCAEGPDIADDDYDLALEAAVAETYGDRGIPVFMIAIDFADDTQTAARLNAIAIAGGYPRTGLQRFYDAADEATMLAALEDITSKISCTVSFETPAHGPDYTSIVIGGETWPRVDACEDGDGWRLTATKAPYNTIELCGGACEAFAAEGDLTADFSCPVAG